MMATCLKCRRKPERIEIVSGPDSLNRYTYVLVWCADYHPGHPEGEYRHAERAQVFFALLPARNKRR